MTASITKAGTPFDDTDKAAELLARLERQSQCHSAKFEDRHMAWRCFGDGPPLVLIHGGHGNWLHWVRNIEALADRFSVWVPDLPGYGDSDAAASVELSSVVEPTLATLDAVLGADSTIDLVGFSFGGLVAAHIAARRSQIRRLILLGPAGHGGPRRPRGKLLPWRDAVAAQDEVSLAAIMRHNLAMHMLHDPGQIDALAIKVHTEASMRTRFRSKELSQASGLSAALAKQSAEILVVWGEHDVTVDPQAASRVLAAVCPRLQAHIMPGAGHWVQFESANAINRMLLA